MTLKAKMNYLSLALLLSSLPGVTQAALSVNNLTGNELTKGSDLTLSEVLTAKCSKSNHTLEQFSVSLADGNVVVVHCKRKQGAFVLEKIREASEAGNASNECGTSTSECGGNTGSC